VKPVLTRYAAIRSCSISIVASWFRKGWEKRVAVARKLGIRLWIMLRDEIDYEEFCRRGQKQQSGAACAGMLKVANGANRHRPVD
jgi:hypothetical protein